MEAYFTKFHQGETRLYPRCGYTNPKSLNLPLVKTLTDHYSASPYQGFFFDIIQSDGNTHV